MTESPNFQRAQMAHANGMSLYEYNLLMDGTNLRLAERVCEALFAVDQTERTHCGWTSWEDYCEECTCGQVTLLNLASEWFNTK